MPTIEVTRQHIVGEQVFERVPDIGVPGGKMIQDEQPSPLLHTAVQSGDSVAQSSLRPTRSTARPGRSSFAALTTSQRESGPLFPSRIHDGTHARRFAANHQGAVQMPRETGSQEGLDQRRFANPFRPHQHHLVPVL